MICIVGGDFIFEDNQEKNISTKECGIIKKRNSCNQDGYSVLVVEQNGKKFTFCGKFPVFGNPKLLSCSFSGQWKNHVKYGMNFSFDSYSVIGSEMQYFFFNFVKGVGAKTTSAILDTYEDEELLSILEERIDVLKEIKGVNKKIGAIKAGWKRYKPLKNIINFLSTVGINFDIAVKVINTLNGDEIQNIKTNPYPLAKIEEIGFRDTDIIAKKLGVKHDSPLRIRSCIQYVFNYNASNYGHTAIAPDKFSIELEKTLNAKNEKKVNKQLIERIMWESVYNGDIIQVGTDWFAAKNYYLIEKQIFNIFEHRAEIKSNPLITESQLSSYLNHYEKAENISFSMKQREAISLAAFGNRTFVICGYAGTGKTTVAKAMLGIYEKIYGRSAILCVALSGIAAERIKELSGFESTTIHSALQYKDTNKEFIYNEENKLPYKVLLVDESSMINNELFLYILKAIDDETILILVGDNAQLQPIGPGDVFNNIVKSSFFKSIMFDKIYRQSSDDVSILFANDIRVGKIPFNYMKEGYSDFSFSKIVYLKQKNHFKYMDEYEKEINHNKIAERIVNIAIEINNHNNNKVRGLQVLSPMRGTILGTSNLNCIIQNAIGNKKGYSVNKFGMTYRVGEKVVHTTNKNMNIVLTKNYKLFGFHESNIYNGKVYNGNIGIIIDIDEKAEVVYVSYPSGIVVEYDFIDIGVILELAYCLTIHKSQGNEFDNVIIPIVQEHENMINCQLLYTAITRAKKKCYIIGHPEVFEQAILKINTTIRNSSINYIAV